MASQTVEVLPNDVPEQLLPFVLLNVERVMVRIQLDRILASGVSTRLWVMCCRVVETTLPVQTDHPRVVRQLNEIKTEETQFDVGLYH